MLIEIFLFLVFYSIDLSTALFHRWVHPNNFLKYESNMVFRRCLEQYGTWKGVKKYTLIHFFELSILFVAFCVAASIVFDATILQGIRFTFILLIVFHILGAGTNLVAVAFRKEDGEIKEEVTNSC